MPNGQLLDQHVVSAVLLRRWTENRRLLVYDMRYDSVRLRSPRAEGYITGLIRVGAAEFEAKWAAIEQRIPPVFSAVDNGVIFDNATLVGHLKDFIALHFSRSRTMREVHRRSMERAIEKLIQDGDDLRHPDRLDELFLLRYGLHSAGPEGRMAAYEAALREVRSQIEEGSGFFGERIDANFERIREDVNRWGIQIGVAADGAEFVISDDPVQTIDSATGRVGVLSGVPVSQADALVLPLGPRHIISASKTDEYFSVPKHGVTKLNSAQFVAAHEKVFCRPGSGLEASAREWRLQQIALIDADARGDGTAGRPDAR